MLLPSLSVFLSYVIIIFFRTITNIINITISIISNISNITANATPKVSLGLQPFLTRAFNPPGARQQSPDLPTRKGSICSSNLQPEHFYFSTETSPEQRRFQGSPFKEGGLAGLIRRSRELPAPGKREDRDIALASFKRHCTQMDAFLFAILCFFLCVLGKGLSETH